VGAALRRGDQPGQIGRRSGDSGPTFGSHTPPKATIFIGGGELEKLMGHFTANSAPTIQGAAA
jgi:hypothetical protein